MIIAYIRVSTSKQDLENQRNTVLQHANQKKMIVDEFVEIEMSSRRSQDDRCIRVVIDRRNYSA